MGNCYSYGSYLMGQWAVKGSCEDYNEAKTKADKLQKSNGGLWSVKESYLNGGTLNHGIAIYSTVYNEIR